MEKDNKNTSKRVFTGKSKLDEKKYNAFNEKVVFKPTVKSTRERLGELWMKASEAYTATTTLQRELENEGYAPVSGYSAASALNEFMRLRRVYEAESVTRSAFDAANQHSDLKVCCEKVYVGNAEEPMTIVGGSFETLNPQQMSARECANIILTYTKLGDDDASIPSATPDEYARAFMPKMDLCSIRDYLNATSTDILDCFDTLYTKLSHPANILLTIGITSYILGHAGFEQYRVTYPSDSVLKRYQQVSVDRLGWPIITQAYSFGQTVVNSKHWDTYDYCFRFRDSSIKIRGDQKRIGRLSTGYYRWALTPAQDVLYSRMSDMVMLLEQISCMAVRLIDPDYPLASLLVSNGYTVYSESMGTIVEPAPTVVRKNKKIVSVTYADPGIYTTGSRMYFSFFRCNQSPPSVSSTGTAAPEVRLITGTAPVVYEEYIPPAFDTNYMYLPSIMAESGMCYKTNASVKGVDHRELLMRFSGAVYYRNFFVVSRLTFIAQDVYRNFFRKTWIIPRILKEDLLTSMREAALILETKRIVSESYDMTKTTDFTAESIPIDSVPETNEEDIIQATDLIASLKDKSSSELASIIGALINRTMNDPSILLVARVLGYDAFVSELVVIRARRIDLEAAASQAKKTQSSRVVLLNRLQAASDDLLEAADNVVGEETDPTGVEVVPDGTEGIGNGAASTESAAGEDDFLAEMLATVSTRQTYKVPVNKS